MSLIVFKIVERPDGPALPLLHKLHEGLFRDSQVFLPLMWDDGELVLVLRRVLSYTGSTKIHSGQVEDLEFKIHARAYTDRNPKASVEVDIVYYPKGISENGVRTFGTVTAKYVAYQKYLFGNPN